MPNITIPQFGELLRPLLSQVPASAYPGFLARLERSAAARYRGWAEAVPEHAMAYSNAQGVKMKSPTESRRFCLFQRSMKL